MACILVFEKKGANSKPIKCRQNALSQSAIANHSDGMINKTETVCLKFCKMEETRSAVLKRRISELEAKNERLEQDNKKLKQECECYEVKQLKQGMEELHAALKPRFFL